MKSESKTNDKTKTARAQTRKKTQESAAEKKLKAEETRRKRTAAAAYRTEKKANIRKRSKKPKTLAEQRERKEKGPVFRFLSRYKRAFDLFMIPVLFFAGGVIYCIAVPSEREAVQWCVQMSDNLFGAAGIVFFIWLFMFSARYLLGMANEKFRTVPYGKYMYFLGLFLFFELILQHNTNKIAPGENPADSGGIIADAIDRLLVGALGQGGTVVLFVLLLLFFIWKAWRYLLKREAERGEPLEDVPIKVYWENVHSAVEAEKQEELLHTDIETDFQNASGLLTAQKTEAQPQFSARLKQKSLNAWGKLKEAFHEITAPLPEQGTADPILDEMRSAVMNSQTAVSRQPEKAAAQENLPKRNVRGGNSPAVPLSRRRPEPEPFPEPEPPAEELFPEPEEEYEAYDAYEVYDAGEFEEPYDPETAETDEANPGLIIPEAEEKPRKAVTAAEEQTTPRPPVTPRTAAAEKPRDRAPRQEPSAGIQPSQKLSTASAPIRSPQSSSFKPNLTQEAAQADASATPQDPWILPDCAQILDPVKQYKGTHPDDPAVLAQSQKIERLLDTFGAPSKVVEIQCGPTFSQFGVEPGFIERGGRRTRVRIKQIENLQKDLEMELSVKQLTIEAPIPGKTYVGVQVQNKSRTPVSLREVLENPDYRKRRRELGFALGKDINGEISSADLTRMPHLLIAGATGSGKSVCLNAILVSLLMYNTPNQMKLILVDPKHVELSGYNGIPHLITPVVTDVEQVGNILQWVLREMDMRNIHFMEKGVRNIQDYNRKFPAARLPYIVIVIDELANLMMEAGSDIESSIVRLAQTARAMGIHLIVATQRPSRDVLTGTIKGNLPTRIAFAVSSYVDSQVILDRTGAEKLFGKGDMYFLSTEETALKRLQGVYVSDDEIRRLVSYWQSNPRSDKQQENSDPDLVPVPQPVTQKVSRGPALYDGLLTQMPSSFNENSTPLKKEGDSLYDDAVKLVQRSGRASANMLVSQMSIGFTRANKLLAAMEDNGIIGPPNANPAIPREVLDYGKYGPANDGEKD